MVFSQESSQAIFEMGYKTSMTQCPHNVFKRDNSSPMRKAHQTRSGYDATNQSCPRSPEGAIHAFARLRLLQGVTNMALIFGRNTTTKQKTRNVVVRKNKRQYTSIWDRWQRDETYRESQLVHEWSDASVRYLDHTAKNRPLPKAPHSQRERYNNLLYLRSVNEDKQAPPLPQRPGYQDAKKALLDIHKQSTTRLRSSFFIPKVQRQRLQNQFDPSMQRYLEWLKHLLGWVFCRRTTPVDILFCPDTKFILVDLVLLDFGLASTRT